MTDKQPEALRLAEILESYYAGYNHTNTAAAELRRLHEVEIKFHESVGGFKRDLAEKLEQQRKKNTRLTDELRRLEKDYVARDADLRRLHEVNAELVLLLEDWMDTFSEYAEEGDASLVVFTQEAIAKATGEQQ